jgi:hypothetical protein
MPFDGVITKFDAEEPLDSQAGQEWQEAILRATFPFIETKHPRIPVAEICRLVLEAHDAGVLQATARVAGLYNRGPTMEVPIQQARTWVGSVLWFLRIKEPLSVTYYCAAGYVQHATGYRQGTFHNPEVLANFTEDPEDFKTLVNWHDAIVHCRDEAKARTLLRNFVAAVRMVAHGEARRFAPAD